MRYMPSDVGGAYAALPAQEFDACLDFLRHGWLCAAGL